MLGSRRPTRMTVNDGTHLVEAKLACHLSLLVNFGEEARKAPCVRKTFNLNFGSFNYAPHGNDHRQAANVRNGRKADISP